MLLARFARLGKAWGAVGGCFEPGIAETASAAFGNDRPARRALVKSLMT
jgi:hypothetical protein